MQKIPGLEPPRPISLTEKQWKYVEKNMRKCGKNNISAYFRHLIDTMIVSDKRVISKRKSS